MLTRRQFFKMIGYAGLTGLCLGGYAVAIEPSRYGNRYTYGHVVEDNRHLIVSGGLGCSILPVRFGMPPEITLVEIGTERLRAPSDPAKKSPAG